MELFAYQSLADDATYHEVVGHYPDAVPAVLPGYRILHSLGYAYLEEDSESQVEGRLVRHLQAPEIWVLDDYHGVAEGLYERRQVQVRTTDSTHEAWSYVGGPTMAQREELDRDTSA